MTQNQRIFLLAILFATAFASTNSYATEANKIEDGASFQNCGLSLTVPLELSTSGQPTREICIDSYRKSNGAVLSFASPTGTVYTPSSWENLPILHIYRQSLNDALTKNNGSGIRSQHPNSVVSTTPRTKQACHLIRRTRIKKISGPNWQGWLAEDSYKKTMNPGKPPEYCEQYSAQYRCLRMLIGNRKEVATMSQYCMTRNADLFDLDGGINHDTFLRIVYSIRFHEE